MKRTLALIAVLGAFGLVQAQGNLTGEFKLGVATQDIWRGTLVNDGMTVIPMLDLGFGTGTHLTARGSLGLEGDGMDEWRFGAHHDLDLVAMTLSFGATLFDREGSGGDTTEVWAAARMKWLTPFTFMAAMDIDEIEGMYFRVSTGSGVGASVPILGANANVSWDIWLGYADDDYAVYYGSAEGGFADLGGKVSANFALQEATLSVWAMVTTLVDPDFTTFTGDRTNYSIGASMGWRF
jgi:hypothetical protein